MEQHSVEWWAARCGKVTASRMGDLLRRTKKGVWAADRNNYLREKAAERITGKNRDRRKVASLDYRLDLEPDARTAYEFYTGNTVALVGFIDHPRIPNAGCSPDGLVGNDGGLELKCLDPETMLDVWISDSFDSDYIDQCHFGMACTGRKWWDFGAYCPEMLEEGKLYLKRIHRDESLISVMEQAVIEFNEEVDRKVEQALAAINGSSALEVVLKGSLQSLGVH